MLFFYIHTHPLEKCLADKPEESRQMMARVMQASAEAGVKILGVYAAPQEHTIFTILEADDFPAASRAMIPLTTWGTARLIPVLSAEQMAALGA